MERKDNTSNEDHTDQFTVRRTHSKNRQAASSIVAVGILERAGFQNLQRRLHLVQNSTGELVSGSLTTHVAGHSAAFADNIVDGLGNAVGVIIETKVTQEHGARQDHSTRVGLILALDVETDVTAARLEDSNVTAHVATGDETGSTNESSADVGQNTTVKVRHDHNIELLGTGHSLHGSVVHNHVVHLQGGVVLSDLVECAAEETIGQLHDVGLVNAGNLLAVVGQGEAESELGNTLGLGAGDDLEGLDDTVDGLVLEAGVLSLGVLTDDAEVDILVASLVTGDVLDQGDGGVDVQLLTEGNVEGLVARALNRSVEDTLQTELVALEGSQGLAEELLGVLVTGVNTANIDLLPLNGNVVGLEDGLDRFGDLSTDTVTRDEGHGVLATILGGLEDVRLNTGEGSGGNRATERRSSGGAAEQSPCRLCRSREHFQVIEG